jgi:pimeloyl-ACP methyl ester carboxylesterase
MGFSGVERRPRRSTPGHGSAHRCERDADVIVGAMAIAELEVIEAAGHFTWLDAPEAYWPVIVSFVERVSARLPVRPASALSRG